MSKHDFWHLTLTFDLGNVKVNLHTRSNDSAVRAETDGLHYLPAWLSCTVDKYCMGYFYHRLSHHDHSGKVHPYHRWVSYNTVLLIRGIPDTDGSDGSKIGALVARLK